MEEEDDIITLSEHTRLALECFLKEKQMTEIKSSEHSFIEEDWELSQFWYDRDTSLTLAKAAFESVGETGRIACVSCPSIYKELNGISPQSTENFLFEYDKRFQEKFQEQAIFYDYNDPINLKEKFKLNFDIVLADPPYLSQECLEKFSETIKFLTNKKIVVCTGAVMEGAINNLLNLRACSFTPKHERKLGNEFKCYANFDFDSYINEVKPVCID